MSIFGRNAFGMTDLLSEKGPSMDLLNDTNVEDGGGVDIAAQSDEEGSAEEEQETAPIVSLPVSNSLLKLRVPPTIITRIAPKASAAQWYQRADVQIAAVVIASLAVLGVGAAVAMHASKAKANCGW